jgi:hypothetical protein
MIFSSALSLFSFLMSSSSSGQIAKLRNPPTLPDKLIVGYANWHQCDDLIIDAVKNGVNVVIWFAVNLGIDSEGYPVIEKGPDFNCVAQKIKQIRDLDLTCPTIHLISIGGWNANHPDTKNSALDTYQNWHKWNTETIANQEYDFKGFDGFDW